jgi:hypothetical protein
LLHLHLNGSVQFLNQGMESCKNDISLVTDVCHTNKATTFPESCRGQLCTAVPVLQLGPVI